MADAQQNPAKKKLPLMVSAAVLLLSLCVVGVLVMFMQKKDIVSAYALVDGMIYSVATEINAKIEQVLVSEGDVVKEGQPVVILEATGFTEKVKVVEQEVRDLRPPDMVEIDQRLKEATEAEAGTISRIASVRHEEERKKQQRDTAVMRHVQAELAMRSAETMYGINSHEYNARRIQEENARAVKKQAQEAYEKSANVRAALNQELARIRYEVQEAKKYESFRRAQSFSEPLKQSKPEIEYVPNPPENLRSPTDGLVFKINVRPGDSVEKGKPLVMITPSTPGKGDLWIEAWFKAEDADKLKKGQAVKIEKSDGTVFHGIIKTDFALSPLPQGVPRGESDTYVSAHIDVQGNTALKTGDKVVCKFESKAF